jgi:hypothetical protein
MATTARRRIRLQAMRRSELVLSWLCLGLPLLVVTHGAVNSGTVNSVFDTAADNLKAGVLDENIVSDVKHLQGTPAPIPVGHLSAIARSKLESARTVITAWALVVDGGAA